MADDSRPLPPFAATSYAVARSTASAQRFA